MNAPKPPNESERLDCLRGYGVLDTPRTEHYDDITQLAADVCGTPIAIITLIDEERQWFKSAVGFDIAQTPLSHAFCAHTILQSEMMIVPNALDDERFKDNPLVTGFPNIRFYAGMPLITPEGFALGSLCVADTVPHAISDVQRMTLRTLARDVVTHLELERRAAIQERLVAERAAAEKERRRSDESLRQLGEALAHAVEGIIVTDARLPDCPITYCNPAFLALTGYASEEILGRNCRFLQGPDTEPAALDQMREAIRTEQRCRVTLRNYKKDGTPFWNELTIAPIRDEAGRLTHFAGLQHDVTVFVDEETARKRAELERERLLSEALERADRDPLTNVLNHRVFQNRLDHEAVHALRTDTVLAVIVVDLDNFRFFNDAYGHATGDGVLLSVAQRLTKVARYDVVARYGGDEFALLMRDVGGVSHKEIEAIVQADLDNLSYRPDGQMTAIPITVSCGVALYPYGALDRHEVIRRAEERLQRTKTGGAVEADEVRTAMLNVVSGFSMLDALVTAVDNKDRYTRRHSEDVMAHGLVIARELGLSETLQHTIAVAALLHDVGKIGVPDHILRKPGRLTDEEFEAVKQHPQMGAIMVSSVPGLEETLDAVRHHHERWDGNGYPFGLKGEETPLIARLMAVADAFSAMTMDRPYRKGMERMTALATLESGAGTQWDALCVKAFARALRRERQSRSLKAA